MSTSLIAFDLDGTLTPSKQQMTQEMAPIFARLCQHVDVCVISGGTLEQFEYQFLSVTNLSDRELVHLHLMPTCGTRYLVWGKGEWKEQYNHQLTPSQRTAAIDSLRTRAQELGLWEDTTWGDVIDDRGSQITYSALGQHAPLEPKATWDPDGSKRARLARYVQADLPELTVRGGGATSVDVTLKGVDKAYGMRQLLRVTGIPASQMMFFGDRLDPDGNDYPVRSTGIPCVEVADWRDTAERIMAFLDQYLAS